MGGFRLRQRALGSFKCDPCRFRCLRRAFHGCAESRLLLSKARKKILGLGNQPLLALQVGFELLELARQFFLTLHHARLFPVQSIAFHRKAIEGGGTFNLFVAKWLQGFGSIRLLTQRRALLLRKGANLFEHVLKRGLLGSDCLARRGPIQVELNGFGLLNECGKLLVTRGLAGLPLQT